ncbi:MAG TPA: sorbitol dehydrogenase [Thermoanaerobaculia bacterium]|jgi:hypothetical protein
MSIQPVPTPVPPPSPEVDIQDFANMSAALTGFLPSVIKPLLDPVNLAGTYYDFIVKEAGNALMLGLLNAYRAIATQPPQTIADTLLETRGTLVTPQGQLAQQIVALWYLGSWYDWPSQKRTQVVSMQAYTNGLAWKVAQAHPMGFSPYTFGYWADQPPPLSSFGVNDGGAK